MVKFMKQAVDKKPELNHEDRNYLSVAYKNHVGAGRAAWRVLYTIEQREEVKEHTEYVELIRKYRSSVEEELRDICRDILSLISDKLVPACSGVEDSTEAYVFYRKMAGDYNRYLAEFLKSGDREKATQEALNEYDVACKKAKESLPPYNPIRLGLMLNFSVFYYEIMNDPDTACTLAKEAFDEAVAELDHLSEESYKDATLIMQLLRDNLTLWTADQSVSEQAVVEADGTAVQDAE